MVSSPATSVAAYLESLPAGRRAVIEDTMHLIRRNIPPGYDEGMLYGMIAWYVPRSRLAETYNGQPLCSVALAAQKHYTALYLMSVDGTSLETEFRAAFAAAGKKLDMGKSCIRYQSLDDLDLPAVADAVASLEMDEFIEHYHATRAKMARGKGKAAPRKATTKKAALKKAATKAPSKKAATKAPSKKAAPRKTGKTAPRKTAR